MAEKEAHDAALSFPDLLRAPPGHRICRDMIPCLRETAIERCPPYDAAQLRRVPAFGTISWEMPSDTLDILLFEVVSAPRSPTALDKKRSHHISSSFQASAQRPLYTLSGDLDDETLQSIGCLNMHMASTSTSRRCLRFEAPPQHGKYPIGKDHVSHRRTHIFTERQRRRDTSSLFTTLRSLLPEVQTRKGNRCTVLTETIEYIGSLQEKIRDLTKKKSELTAYGKVYRKISETNSEDIWTQVRTKPYVTVSLHQSDAHLTVHSAKAKGVWPQILLFLQRAHLDVVNCIVTTGGGNCLYYFHVKVPESSTIKSDELKKYLEDLTAATGATHNERT